MRRVFFDELIELARRDKKIWLLTGDLGYNLFEPFEKEFPERFLNAGTAEQNMLGMAAGLAMTGAVVFTYSISNFNTVRALEQIRNDICHHCADVKIVSAGQGLAYGGDGYTHHGVEDMGIVRCLPNIKIISPADAHEARTAARLAATEPGPFFIRLDKDGKDLLHKGPVNYEVGKAVVVMPGSRIVMFTTGSIALEACKAAEKLKQRGYDAGVLSFPFVKPLDTKKVVQVACEADWIVTVEEHSPVGGLGSAVAEVLAPLKRNARLHMVALPEGFSEIGEQGWLRNKFGLDSEGIYRTVAGLLKE